MDAAILMSLGPICLYTIIWLGWIKSWYILLPLSGRFNSSMVYALLPIGLSFGMLILSEIFPVPNPTSSNIWFCSFLVLSGVGVLFIVWCPPWLKPPWGRWLEREYGYGLHILLEEARAMGRWQWEARVRTQKEMESWVQEVLERRNEDMYWAWMDWVDYQVIRRMRRKGRDLPEKIEHFMIPHVPKHREANYQHYLQAQRKRIARRERMEKREYRREQCGIVRSFVESFDLGHTFTTADLKRAYPNVDHTIIRQVLNKLRDQRHIKCSGRGRTARWHRTDQDD